MTAATRSHFPQNAHCCPPTLRADFLFSQTRIRARSHAHTLTCAAFSSLSASLQANGRAAPLCLWAHRRPPFVRQPRLRLSRSRLRLLKRPVHRVARSATASLSSARYASPSWSVYLAGI
eukprot:6192672-Pleurochrysis_carterae.AAC.5